MSTKLWISNISVGILGLVGLLYLAIVVVDVNPFQDETTVLVELKETGGLFAESGVTYRGNEVGKIGEIRPRPGGVVVEVTLDGDARIPKDTRVVVSALSAVGEQTLDFRPSSADGPYLAEGDRVPESATETPVRFYRLIESLDGLISQINVDHLHTIIDEAYVGTRDAGPELRRLLGDTQAVMATLDKSLPETTRLLNSAHTVLQTSDALSTGLVSFSKDARRLTATLVAGEPLYSSLLADAPEEITRIVAAAQELTPPALALMDHGSAAMAILARHIPALKELLVMIPIATQIVAHGFRDNALHGIGDPLPSKVCRYGEPIRDLWVVRNDMPDLSHQCTQHAPDLQQRGSEMAPR